MKPGPKHMTNDEERRRKLREAEQRRKLKKLKFRELRKMYHRNSHDTERAAAEFIFPYLSKVQTAVLQYAMRKGRQGFTHHELHADIGNVSKSTYRSRCAYLVEMELIVATKEKRQHGKTKFIVWRYNDEPPKDEPEEPEPKQRSLFDE